jgi:N-methylhydantoinase A
VLDTAAAEKAIAENIARPLGLDTAHAAAAISSLVEDNMANEIFLEAVKKGLDPRNFTLVVGGGAGPVHSVAVAAKLGMHQVYIPKQAAVFCAFGAALADYKYILNRFLYQRDDQVNVDDVTAGYDSLEKEGIDVLARQGVEQKDMKLTRGAEMRYFGQLHDVEVTVPEAHQKEAFSEATLKELIRSFHERHQQLFGWSDPNMPTVLGMLKLQAIGVRPPLALEQQPAAGPDASAALKRTRKVYVKELGRFEETPCYDANRLRHGNTIVGPAIIEETKTTVVLPPGAQLTVDGYENYLVTLS